MERNVTSYEDSKKNEVLDDYLVAGGCGLKRCASDEHLVASLSETDNDVTDNVDSVGFSHRRNTWYKGWNNNKNNSGRNNNSGNNSNHCNNKNITSSDKTNDFKTGAPSKSWRRSLRWNLTIVTNLRGKKGHQKSRKKQVRSYLRVDQR